MARQRENYWCAYLMAGVLAFLVAGSCAFASIPPGNVAAHAMAAQTSGSAATEMISGSSESLTDTANAAVHGEAAPAEAGGEQPELPNLITVILHTKIGGKAIADTKVGHFLHVYEKQIFLVISSVFLSVLIFGTLRLRAMKPGRGQVLLEIIVEKFYAGFGSVLGPGNEKYVPFLGTLFVFILVNNLMGIIPLFAAATSKFQTTATLAGIVFFYVHFNAIKESGVFRWLHHIAGSPNSVSGWCAVPLIFPLEVIGELAKPLSLALRLFGNIMGEDILVGVFMVLGISMMKVVWHEPLVGFPLHLPFYFLAVLTSTIQALVFALLATVYIALLLPHKAEEGGHH